jgi:M6 family metalloprotease-like protein
VDTYEDEYGDTWYCYDKGELCVDMAYYETEDGYCADVYAFFWTEDGGGNTGSGDVGGDDSGDVGGDTDVEIMTNAGKGLPTGVNGVYNVDFTKATHVKNVTDQGYYLDGCPTVSGNADPAVLVIPVEFSDVTAASKGYTVTTIKKAFNGGAGETDYYSVHEYYLQSSYGKLDLDITVLDSWFKPQYASSYYANATMDCEGYETACGDQLIIDEALAYLSKSMDLSKFDSDSNGVIDAIVLINTLDINDEVDFQWAYRYWNMYTDDEGYYYEYDGVSANDYLWASYQFLHESESGWDDTTGINTYTYIHEFGHVLGADDYYDTAYVGSPMGDFDMMDGMAGDHNAYSKFNYGWLTTSRLVVADESVTLTIEDFSKNGDTVLIANNWDETLGAYQEYYIVVYYTNNGVNVGGGYFDDEGIVVYHVNASLYKEIYEGETYYDVYNNNTDASDEYGTEDNLIEYVTTKTGEYVYGVGDSLSASTTDDQGNKIAYTFTVDALTDTTATLTFTKNK